MPVIARCDHDRVDTLVVEQLPKVRIFFSTAMFLSRALEMLFIRIAQCRDTHITQSAELFEQLIAAAAGSDETKIELFVLALRSRSVSRQSQTDGGRRLHYKCATIDRGH